VQPPIVPSQRSLKTTTTIRIVKRRIGYDSEEEEVHDVRKGIFNMAMNEAEET